MADVKGLLSDPRFQQLDLASQKAVLGQVDSRFANLSDDEYGQFKAGIAPQAAPQLPQQQNQPGFWSEMYSQNVQPVIDLFHSVAAHGGFGALQDMAGGILDSQAQAGKQAWDALSGNGSFAGYGPVGRVLSGAGYGLGGALPVVGPAAIHAGENIGSGNYGAGAADVLSLAGQMAAPEVAKRVGGIAPAIGESYYNAQVKTPKAVSIADADAAKAFGYQQNVPVSRAGLARLGDVNTPGTTIFDLNKAVEDEIASQHQVVGTVGNQLANQSTILEPIQDELQASHASDLASSQAYRDAIQAEIQPQLDKWKRNPPTVDQAQTLKKRLYKEISDSQWSDANGSVTQPAKLAKELLARGLKNAVNEKVPAVAGLNETLHNAITLQDAITDAVKRNPSSLHTLLIAAGIPSEVFAGVATGHPLAGLGAVAANAVGALAYKALRDPATASRLALALKDTPRAASVLGEIARTGGAVADTSSQSEYSTAGIRSAGQNGTGYIPASLPLK